MSEVLEYYDDVTQTWKPVSLVQVVKVNDGGSDAKPIKTFKINLNRKWVKMKKIEDTSIIYGSIINKIENNIARFTGIDVFYKNDVASDAYTVSGVELVYG